MTKRRAALHLAIFSVSALASCSSDETAGTSERVCIPGQSVACVGEGGCSGGQACRGDGSGYEFCSCSQFDTGPAAPDTTIDAAESDSSPDTNVASDSFSPETLVPDSSPLDAAETADGADVDTSIADTASDACVPMTAPATRAPVDVIVTIDQSGSMSDDIANVRSNINRLSDSLKSFSINYRIVMIASPGSGATQVCVPPPLGGITCGAPNGTVFKQVPQTVASTDVLKVTVNTYDTAPGPWSDMLRGDALKVFVPISDDDSVALTASEFDTQIIAKGTGQFGTTAKRNYVVYPIVGAPAFPTESPKCGTNAASTGAEYIALAKLTRGKWFPICLTDFGPVFVELGKSIATKVACELTLPPPPSGGPLETGKVNATITTGTGGTVKLLRDDTQTCDGGANGWQYSSDGKKLLVCGDACRVLQSDLGSVVNVVFGCATEAR